jgi:hypothetical protein
MSQHFYVTGLPRSRTAWLANFLTHRNAFCHHEAMNGCHSVDEYLGLMNMDYDFVGNSDCGLFLSPCLIDGPLVIIERDINEVEDSLSEIFNGIYVRQYCEQAQEKLDQLNGLRIPFDDINDNLEEIWCHCIGDGFDGRRAEQLKNFNIQLSQISGDPISLEVFSCLG